MDKLTYKVESFEGPLDLLLTLLAKNKMTIFEISISQLLQQYMAQIDAMRQTDMEVASEFLEMAARLVYLKTVSLLPRQQSEEEQLRRELSGELMEYALCKQLAQKLGGKCQLDFYQRVPMRLPKDPAFRGKIAPAELVNAYLAAVGRGKRLLPPPVQSFSGIVSHRVVSVSSQIVNVLRRLWRHTRMQYGAFFRGRTDRSEKVAAFLALLELVKGSRIRIDGDGNDAQITLCRREDERKGKTLHGKWKEKQEAELE